MGCYFCSVFDGTYRQPFASTYLNFHFDISISQYLNFLLCSVGIRVPVLEQYLPLVSFSSLLLIFSFASSFSYFVTSFLSFLRTKVINYYGDEKEWSKNAWILTGL